MVLCLFAKQRLTRNGYTGSNPVLSAMKTILLILTISFCSCQNKKENSQRLIYQPEFLIVDKDTKITTVDGVYIVPEKQIWYSQKKVMDLEKVISQF